MGLTQKILLFTSLLVVALVGGTVAYTTVEAERMARQSIEAGLGETRSVWETFQADRYRKLKLGVRVLANDSPFKATVESGDQATIHDMLEERGRDLGADFFVATDASGVVLARSDRPNRRTSWSPSRWLARTRPRCGGRTTSCSTRSRCPCSSRDAPWAC